MATITQQARTTAGPAHREADARPGSGPHLDWVDVAKGLGMILVFQGHVLEGMYGLEPRVRPFYKFIYAFHMPLFFLISGFLASTKPFDLRRRVLTRLVPVVFFDLLGFVPRVAIDVGSGTIRPGLYAYGLAVLSRGYPFFNFMLWFVVALFSIELIDRGLCVVLGSRRRAFLASWLLFALGVAVTRKEKFFIDATGLGDSFWFLKQALLALPFYEAGALLRSRSRRPAREVPGWAWVAALAIGGGLLLVLFDRNVTVNLSAARIGNPALMIVNGLLGTLMIVAIARLAPPARPLLFLGRNTLALLGINGLLSANVNWPVAQVIVRVSPDLRTRLALSILVTALSLLASIPLVVALDRFTPRALGKPDRNG